MRGKLASAFLILCLAASGQAFSQSKISPIPDGTLSANIYTNDALGLRFEFPEGWTPTPDPKGPVAIDWRGPNKPANQCSRILLSLEAPGKVEGRFNSIAILLAIDPGCIAAAPFPQSLHDNSEIAKVAKQVGKCFSYTPYMSPFGNQVQPFTQQGRVIIGTQGTVLINALESPGKKEPLDVNTSLTFTESKGYWIAWGFMADAHSTEELAKAKLTFNGAAPQ